MKISQIILLYTFVVASSLLAQDLKTAGQEVPFQDSELYSSLSYNIDNGIKALKSPLTFNTNDWFNTGLVAGATAIAFALDNTVRDNVNKLHTMQNDKLVSFAQYYGRAQYFVVGGGLLYLGGNLIGNRKLEQTGGMLTQALLVTGVYTVAMKVIFGRSRPFENEGAGSIEGFQLHNSDNSFPSGHTSTAFAVSTVLAKQFDNTYASILLYSLAGATAFQRIYSDNHWFSDTLLGAALGYFIGSRVYELNKGKVQNDYISSLSINPVYMPSGLGVSVNYSF